MAPTEGRVARPERRWSCRRGTPASKQVIHTSVTQGLQLKCYCLVWQLKYTWLVKTTGIKQ